MATAELTLTVSVEEYERIAGGGPSVVNASLPKVTVRQDEGLLVFERPGASIAALSPIVAVKDGIDLPAGPLIRVFLPAEEV